MRRGSRLVVLPDFQGIGIGGHLHDLYASVWTAKGYRYRGVAAHPALIAHALHSDDWIVDRHGFLARQSDQAAAVSGSHHRLTASMEYVGAPATALTVQALGY
jgi:hypothetical protein